jgi:transcriptional regulator with XRE-family HTH domain
MSAEALLDSRWRAFLYAWGQELRTERLRRGLTTSDVARIVGLGARFTAADVERLEWRPGRRSDVQGLMEITEALDLGVLVALGPADGFRRQWELERPERQSRRKDYLAGRRPTADIDEPPSK